MKLLGTSKVFQLILGWLLTATLVPAVPTEDTGTLLETIKPQTCLRPLHDRHSWRPLQRTDYDNDMKRAKSLGIDAFALNIGTDSITDQQLTYAYQSAANNGMKVCTSFDFNF